MLEVGDLGVTSHLSTSAHLPKESKIVLHDRDIQIRLNKNIFCVSGVTAM